MASSPQLLHKLGPEVAVSRNAVLAGDERLRMALDAMPHKVWIVEINGEPVYYNPAMRDFAGSALQLPDRASREHALISPDDLARFVQMRDEAVLTAKDWVIEIRLRCRNGTFRWHRLNFSVLRNKQQQFAYLAIATDIDDLQQALAVARGSEEQMRLAAEAARLGVYAFDLQTGEHTWSAELKRIFGLRPDQPPPQRIIDMIHPADRAKFQRARQASFSPGGPGTFDDEHRITRPDGAERWLLVKGRSSFVGEGASRRAATAIGIVLDITQRKHAEQALAQSETRYRMIFEHADDLVATLQLDGHILSINPAAREILGYAPEELIGKTIYEFVPREFMDQQEGMLRRKLEGEPATRYDLEVIRKDKRRSILSVSSRLVSDADDKPAFIHSIARDVTERRHSERRQQLLVRELQHRTKNLLAVIQSIAANTFKSDAALETFVGRLHALAHAQDFVAAGPQGGVPLHQLVEAGLAPFGSRAKVEGEDLIITGGFAQNLALLLHELATNSVKYGAFRSSKGSVAIKWETVGGDDGYLSFMWNEYGAPPAQRSARKGFGTLLMASFPQARTSFTPHGLAYEFQAPLCEVSSGGADAST